VQKSILAELQVRPKETKKGTVGPPESDDENDGNDENENESPILDIAMSETGSKLFMLLLSRDEESRKKYFDPAELEILHLDPKITENGEEVSTSKKNSKTRRSELLQYMKKLLVELCTSHANALLRSRCGSKVIREVHSTYPSRQLTEAIANTCDAIDVNTGADDNDSGNDKGGMSMFEHPIGHLSIKSIILNEASSMTSLKDSDGNLSLSSELRRRYSGKLVETVASSNRGAFVLAAIVEGMEKDDKKREISTNGVKTLLKLSKKNDRSIAGYEALLKAMKK